MTAAIRKIFVDNPAEFDPRKYLGPARDDSRALQQVRERPLVVGRQGLIVRVPQIRKIRMAGRLLFFCRALVAAGSLRPDIPPTTPRTRARVTLGAVCAVEVHGPLGERIPTDPSAPLGLVEAVTSGGDELSAFRRVMKGMEAAPRPPVERQRPRGTTSVAFIRTATGGMQRGRQQRELFAELLRKLVPPSCSQFLHEAPHARAISSPRHHGGARRRIEMPWTTCASGPPKRSSATPIQRARRRRIVPPHAIASRRSRRGAQVGESRMLYPMSWW